MSYQTGTATDAANLKSLIETFAQSNGWTLSSGVLSCSFGAVELTTELLSGSTWQRLRVSGADNVGFTTNVCSIPPAIGLYAGSWPVTYHLFAHATPVPVLFCIIQYGSGMHQHLSFGGMVKYGAWGGGLWVSGSIGHPYDDDLNKPFRVTQDNSAWWNPFSHAGSMFWNSGWESPSRTGSTLRCDLDGSTVPWTAAGNVIGTFDPLHKRMPAAWNNQVQLLPYSIAVPRPSGFSSLVGQIPHIRATRNTYLEPGDVITEGADRWKVFPWVKRDAANPAGGQGHSGTVAVALFYDGP